VDGLIDSSVHQVDDDLYVLLFCSLLRMQITEKYAFLPREAVTKFLLQCTDCQKRGSPGVSEDLSPGKTSSRSSSRSGGGDQLAKGSANKGPLGANSRLPFQLRGKRKQMSEGFAQDIVDDDEVS